MKKLYERPMMVVEEFFANEFVSVCGRTESGEYIFTCDAPAGDAYTWSDGFSMGLIQIPGRWKHMGEFKPCKAKHTTENPNSYETKAIDVNGNGKIEEDTELFLYWPGPDSEGRTGHFTASLTAGMVETLRS